MEKLKLVLIGFLMIFSTVQCFGQVATRFFTPQESLKRNKSLLSKSDLEKLVLRTMPTIDVGKLLEEDKDLEGLDVPLNTGYIFDVDYTLKDGLWNDINSKRVWSMRFHSKGAYYMNFTFSELNLSSGAELYISNIDGSMVYGPITAEQNVDKGVFITDLISGDDVVIQLVESGGTNDESILRINKVVHGYRDYYSYAGMSRNVNSDTWTCHNDVNCYPIWKNESNGVALVIIQRDNKQGFCTGSLLNNTALNKKSYFLSAFHCVDLDEGNKGVLTNSEVQVAENWAFRFQYKSNACNGNGQIVSYTYNQAYLRASWWNTDFVLMELKASLINAPFPITYLGWNRSPNAPNRGTGIHHPNGDLMKISFCNTIIPSNVNPIRWSGAPSGHYWCPIYTSGTTQAGSSGSPLFDASKKVIGQLSGGDAKCAPATKAYGKFNLSWTGGGSNNSRLSNWLDPSNKGVTTLDPLFSYPSSTTGSLQWHSETGSSGVTSYNNNGSPVTISPNSSTHIYLDWYLDALGQNYPLDTNEEVRIVSVSSRNSSVLAATLFDTNCISIYSYNAGNSDLLVKVVDGLHLHDFIIPVTVLRNYSYRVYPNPATALVTIAPVESENITASGTRTIVRHNFISLISVYDLTGNCIIQKNFGEEMESVQLDVSSLKKGVYNIIVSNGKEQSSMNIVIN